MVLKHFVLSANIKVEDGTLIIWNIIDIAILGRVVGLECCLVAFRSDRKETRTVMAYFDTIGDLIKI